MRYEEYTQMSTIYKEELESNTFRLYNYTLTEDKVKFEKMRSLMNGSRECLYLEAGDYTVLKDKKKKEVVMSDTWMEQITNLNFVNKANGDVLIGGLGIGMVLLAIQNKPEVKSITVVEISQELYDLIMPTLSKHLNDKVKIVISDIHDFIPDKKYDVIYCDIWNNVSSDNWDEMKKLTMKFKNKVNRENEKNLLDHWRKGDTKRLASEDRKWS